MWRVSRPCAASRCCDGFCDRCSGVFSASVSLPCSQPAGWPPFFVWPALPPPGGCVRDFPLVRPRSVALFPARVPCRLPLLCGFLRPLPCLRAVRFCVRMFSLLFFALFLPNFCLSKFFSFVAQAATGLSFFICARGVVSRSAYRLLLLRPALRCRGLLAVCALCALCARVFSLVSLLFLPNFFLSKLFSLVAQAATGLYFLPKRK